LQDVQWAVELVVVRTSWPGHPRKKKKILAPRIQFPKSNFSALDVFTKKHFGSYVRKFVQSNPCMLNVFLKKKKVY
jgi:hypothetical protein